METQTCASVRAASIDERAVRTSSIADRAFAVRQTAAVRALGDAMAAGD